MDDNNKRPVAIHIEGVSNAKIHGNIATGDADFIRAKNVGNLDAQDNVHITPDSTQDSQDAADDHWYKKPVGVIGLSVGAAMLSAAAIWAVKHYAP